MIYTKTFYVNTTKGVDLIHVGHEVRQALRESKAEKGWVNIVLPRPGCGLVTIEQAEKGGLTPTKDQARLLPKSLMVPIDKGRMAIDPWQDVFLVDYDEVARRREVLVQVWGEDKPAAKPGGPPMGLA